MTEKDEGGDIFVHYTGMVGEGFRALREGERVQFDVEGGPQAKNVKPL